MNNKLIAACLILFSGVQLCGMELDSRHPSFRAPTPDEQPFVTKLHIFIDTGLACTRSEKNGIRRLLVLKPDAACSIIDEIGSLIKNGISNDDLETKIDALYTVLSRSDSTFCDYQRQMFRKKKIHQFPQTAIDLHNQYQEQYPHYAAELAYLKQQLSNIHNTNKF